MGNLHLKCLMVYGSDTGTLINMFLHPVIQVGRKLSRDIHEDLEMAWKDPAYVFAIEKVMMEAGELFFGVLLLLYLETVYH